MVASRRLPTTLSSLSTLVVSLSSLFYGLVPLYFRVSTLPLAKAISEQGLAFLPHIPYISEKGILEYTRLCYF